MPIKSTKKQEIAVADVIDAEAVEADIQPAETGLAIVQRSPAIGYLQPVMDLEVAKARLLELQRFIKFYLVEGEDYGRVPGIDKPVLKKPGADKLCEVYGLADTYPDERIKRVEKWETEPPLFDYEVCCVLTQKGSGIVWGEGLGSCNSWETKYRWRDQNRRCPVCGKEAIIQGKAEYGGGWLCFKKKGGCGAKFMENDPKIINQAIGRIPNDSAADLKNTVLKMAKKRAKIDAVIAATRSSGIFTQDMESIVEAEKINGNGNGNGHQTKAETKAETKVSPEMQYGIEMQPAAAATYETDENPSLKDYTEWLPQCRKLDELTAIFRQAYKQFFNDSMAQAELRRIYEKRKLELGGEPNPEGKTKKGAAKNANGRN